MSNVIPIFRSKAHEEYVKGRIAARGAEEATRRRLRFFENELKQAEKHANEMRETLEKERVERLAQGILKGCNDE